MDLSALHLADLNRESFEIHALLDFCRANGLPTLQSLPITGVALSRFVGPNIADTVYPSIEGDVYSVGGHSFRSWNACLTMFQRAVNRCFPYTLVPISCYRKITAASLLHDIGKISAGDEVSRSTEFFSDMEEKRRKVARHVEIIPMLYAGIDKHIAKRNFYQPKNESSFEELRLSMLFGGLLHHLPTEGYPNIYSLLAQGILTPDEVRTIDEQLDRNRNGTPKEALERIIYGSPLESAIAIALTILPAGDASDAILSEKRPYQDKVFKRKDRLDRLDALRVIFHRAYNKELAELFFGVAYEIYSNPRDFHIQSMFHFGNLLKQQRRKRTHAKIKLAKLPARSSRTLIDHIGNLVMEDSLNTLQIGDIYN